MTTSPPPAWRQPLINAIRILISVGLLTWVISHAGLDNLIRTAQTADPRPYAVAIAISFVGIILRAYRWQILLQAVGARLPFRRTVYLYFVGAFFNSFLPTGFGGDVVRVLEIGDGATSQQAAGTVVVDRLTGFISLFALALLALPFAPAALPPLTVALIAIASVGVMVGSVVLFDGRLLRWLTAHLPHALSLAGDAWLGRTYGIITACGPKAIAGALGMSLLYNATAIVASILVATSLSINQPPSTFILFLPLGAATLLVPSISGFGVREGVYVALFQQVNVGEAQAIAYALGLYSLDLADGLFGGLIYLLVSAAGLRAKPPQ